MLLLCQLAPLCATRSYCKLSGGSERVGRGSVACRIRQVGIVECLRVVAVSFAVLMVLSDGFGVFMYYGGCEGFVYRVGMRTLVDACNTRV